jgi:formate-dependent nitrite reductase membrane component NrfD
MTWEWPLAVYLWLAGIAGGAYFAGFLMSRFGKGKLELLPKVAMLMGVPLVLLGSFLLVLDLGQRVRAWHLFVNTLVQPPRPNLFIYSPMSLGGYFLLIYAVLGIAMIALWWVGSFEPEELRLTVLSGLASVIRPLAPATKVLSWIALVLAVLLASYTGVLLTATNEPLWRGELLLPALFVSSAISTGTAMLVLVMRSRLGRVLDLLFGGEGTPIPRGVLRSLTRVSLVLGVMELTVLTGYVVWLTAFAPPLSAAAARVLVEGPLSLLFWIGVVLVGLVTALALEITEALTGKQYVVGAAFLLPSLVLLGGFMLRLVVLLGGQLHGWMGR